MPDITPIFDLPYPVIADPVQVHTDMQALATEIDDALETVDDARKATGDIQNYDPTWTGPTTIGVVNGQKEGWFTKIGRRVDGQVHIVRGSSTHQGTAVYNFGLPVPQRISASLPHAVSGQGHVRIGASFYPLTVFATATGQVGAAYTDTRVRLGPGTRPGGGTWQANDEFYIQFSYISAS